MAVLYPPDREGKLSPAHSLLRRCHRASYLRLKTAYPPGVVKHLIDVDEDMLTVARAELGTATINETVNEALRRATQHRARRVAAALDVLAVADPEDRRQAWR